MDAHIIQHIIDILLYNIDDIRLVFDMRHTSRRYHDIWLSKLTYYYTAEMRSSDLAESSKYITEPNVFMHITLDGALVFSRPPFVDIMAPHKIIMGYTTLGLNYKYVAYKILVYALISGRIDADDYAFLLELYKK